MKLRSMQSVLRAVSESRDILSSNYRHYYYRMKRYLLAGDPFTFNQCDHFLDAVKAIEDNFDRRSIDNFIESSITYLEDQMQSLTNRFNQIEKELTSRLDAIKKDRKNRLKKFAYEELLDMLSQEDRSFVIRYINRHRYFSRKRRRLDLIKRCLSASKKIIDDDFSILNTIKMQSKAEINVDQDFIIDYFKNKL